MQAAHFILFVNDQARSGDFYRAVLTLEPRLDVPGMTEFELLSGAILGLMPVTSAQRLGLPAGRGGSELYLVVSETERAVARALAAGATLLSPLGPRDWGAQVAYLQDPDGHVLALADRAVG
ncbi:MAG: VOC family protein [Candidatus Eremiobacteraeota bacterium]|nr:VOC family protein [Candidatus Eremiobacteraeota bacterium]